MNRKLVVLSIGMMAGALWWTGCATPSTEPPPAVMDGSDQQVSRDVRDRLSQDLRLAAQTIGVTVSKGVVTVRGVVPNESMRSQVIGTVRSTPGVKGVLDQLTRQ